MFGNEQDLVVEALRVLFLLAFPVVAALSLAGTLIAALQSATAIHEPALGYAVRLLALVVVLYFMLPNAVGHLARLAQHAFS